MKNLRKTITLSFAITFICVGMTACTQVQPWERGILSKPQMALEPNPLQSSLRAHNLSSREAAANTSSGGDGGGCGCH